MPQTPPSRPPFLTSLHTRVLVYDGAMGTNLQALEPTVGALAERAARRRVGGYGAIL